MSYQILRSEPANCEAIYLKAKALKMQGRFEAAIELYEHVISLGKSETSTIKSIYDMALIRVAERDFYLAYYTLDRIESIPPEIEYLYQLKVFLDGAVHMIKKKYKPGLDSLCTFDQTKVSDPDVGRLALSLRAFGHFNLGEISPALELYNRLEAEGFISEGDVYNKSICKGILAGEAGEYMQAEQHFRKAEQLNRLKVEPYFYIAVGLRNPGAGPPEVHDREPTRGVPLPGRPEEPEARRDQETRGGAGDEEHRRARGGDTAERLQLQHALLRRHAAHCRRQLPRGSAGLR